MGIHDHIGNFLYIRQIASLSVVFLGFTAEGFQLLSHSLLNQYCFLCGSAETVTFVGSMALQNDVFSLEFDFSPIIGPHCQHKSTQRFPTMLKCWRPHHWLNCSPTDQTQRRLCQRYFHPLKALTMYPLQQMNQ
jgi:hypothetical protein